MNIDTRFPIGFHLKLVTGLTINQRFTNFAKEDFSSTNIYTGIISLGVGIVAVK